MKIRYAELVTGLFGITVIAIAVALLVMEGSWDAGFRKSCVAYFDDVGLLENRARVTLNGFDVGTVQSIESVLRDGEEGHPKVLIRVVFDVDGEVVAALKAGTTVKVGQESFLGNRILMINPATGGEAMATEEGMLAFGVVPHSDLMKMAEELKDEVKPLVADLRTALAEFNESLRKLNTGVLSDENLDNIAKIVEGAEGLISDLRGTVANVEGRLMKDDGVIAESERLVRKSQELIDDLKARIAAIQEDAGVSLAKVNDLVDSTRTAVVNVDAETRPKIENLLETSTDAVATARNELVTLRGDVSTTLGNVDALLEDPKVHQIMVELRDTLREARLLTLSLRADPSQLFFGGPGSVEPATAPRRDRSREYLEARGERYEP